MVCTKNGNMTRDPYVIANRNPAVTIHDCMRVHAYIVADANFAVLRFKDYKGRDTAAVAKNDL